ncbi:MAG: DUF1848 domain-containing protein [Azospirillaceae bacterium]
MIVSASYRTDIPAFHADWFARRLAAGSALVKNPYGGQDYPVPLAGDAVDGFVFWTRNLRPFQRVLATLDKPFVVQFTITGYPRRLDPRVPAPDVAAGQLRDLARRFGPRAGVWRYDPVVRTGHLDDTWHRENFARLARSLSGAVDEVVVSLMAPYAKTRRNLKSALLPGEGVDSEPAAAAPLLDDLAAIAGGHGMRLTACTAPGLPALPPARCIDAERLSDVAGRTIAARTRGNRPGCLCAQSRDIGAYDSCGHGCAYCYAVADHRRALAFARERGPAGERLAAVM